jgi:phosphate:Na+ symporter
MFLGGLGLFMFGVETTSVALQKFAADRLKQILHSLTKKTFWAIIFGIIMTVAFQSSAATTVLVVGFVDSGLMNLSQALGIVLGSAVGTSLTVQLIAFPVLGWAMGLIFCGFIACIMGNKQLKYLGQAMIGFGIIFVGMANMSEASAPLQRIPQVYSFLSGLSNHPIIAIVVGLILTTVIQSSTAVFAIMMSLASHHLLGIAAIVPLVLGAHTGGTITTLLTSFTTSKMDAKRTAFANTGYKVLGTIIVYPFLSQYAKLVQWTTSDVQRQVANAHLIFALFMVVIFFPFNNLISGYLKKWFPDKATARDALSFWYIDENALEVPVVALSQVFQEIRGMGKLIQEKMMSQIPRAIMENTEEAIVLINDTEKMVDWYYRHISRFLVSLSKQKLTDEQMEENVNAQFILKELEYVGDCIYNIRGIFYKLRSENLGLTPDAWKEAETLYERILDNFEAVLGSLEHQDQNIAKKIIRDRPEIIRLQRELQFAILEKVALENIPSQDVRTEEKLRYAKIDLITTLCDVNEHTVNIAQVVLGIA